ncbi:hypothetical protein C5746_36515 [Streptomyces atratus]|uniref:Uncharacterized protein n=1 Tax=Streptomyces atratus TaxID=1893 RepID=A0A2Z5JMI0_STRAR|nr:hypothetical protein C5746_36515 [Streptomyces atratus]
MTDSRDRRRDRDEVRRGERDERGIDTAREQARLGDEQERRDRRSDDGRRSADDREREIADARERLIRTSRVADHPVGG